MKICPNCKAQCADSDANCPVCQTAFAAAPPLIYRPLTEDDLPEKFRPLGMWSYFGHMMLYSLPFIGWIFLIIHAISKKNINRRNFARSFFCWWIIVFFLFIIAACAGGLDALASSPGLPL